jgi:DNA-binding response OmpR family regulator
MTRQRLLIVEDDVKTADTLRLYLEHAGYEVALAHDGRESLRRASTTPPPTIVLDRLLPADGLTSVARASARRSRSSCSPPAG